MTSAELPSSVSSPPALRRLPLELLVQIVQEAIATYVAESQWGKAAARCLLSKSLLPFAQEALYHTVPLRGVPETPDDEDDTQWYPSTPQYHPITRNLRLIDTLEAHPRLAACVVEILMRFKGALHIPTTLELDLRALFRACAEIKALDDRASRWTHLRHIAEGLKNVPNALQLESLRFNNLPLDPNRPLPCSSPASKLRHLEMDVLEVWNSDQLPVLPPWQLHSLVIRRFNIHPMDRVLETFLSHSHHTLLRLEITPYLWDFGPVPDLSAFVALQDVTIMVCPDSGDDEERSDEERAADVKRALEYALSLMATCAALTRFELSSPAHLLGAELVVQQVHAIEFLQRLPTSLTTLDVRSLPLSLPILLAYLAADVSPSLRRLDAAHSEGEEERTVLEEACWSRGVELYTHVAAYQYNDGR